MLYIEKITNHRIGNRTPFKDVAESLGWTITLNDDQVEKAYDGSLWEKGYAPTQSLDELKEIKLKELSTITNAFENNLNKDMYFISSLGFKSDGDRRTNMNIAGLINTFDIVSQGDPKTVVYWDYNNELRQLTLEQLKTLLQEQTINGNNLYAQKKQFQDKINNAQSQEELDKIELVFTMMDFTPVETTESSETVDTTTTTETNTETKTSKTLSELLG